MIQNQEEAKSLNLLYTEEGNILIQGENGGIIIRTVKILILKRSEQMFCAS